MNMLYDVENSQPFVPVNFDPQSSGANPSEDYTCGWPAEDYSAQFPPWYWWSVPPYQSSLAAQSLYANSTAQDSLLYNSWLQSRVESLESSIADLDRRIRYVLRVP
jgi:hypothetical protein